MSLYSDLEKGKFYCNMCLKVGCIKELKENPEDSLFLLPPECGHFGRGFVKLSFLNNSWKLTPGLNKLTKPRKRPKYFKHICPNCKFEESTKSSASWVCKECNYSTMDGRNKAKINCFNCNFEFETGSVNLYTCPNCNETKSNIDFEKREYNLKCNHCGEEYNSKFTNGNICPHCNNKNIYYNGADKRTYKHECLNCNFKEETKSSNWVCPKCGDDSFAAKYKHKCTDCGFEEINKQPIGRWVCTDCGSKENLSLRNHLCYNCNSKIQNYSGSYKCYNCGYSISLFSSISFTSCILDLY